MSLASQISKRGLESLNRFYSIYRGIVKDNRDPRNTNSLLVYIPEVLNGITVWAYAKGQPGFAQWGGKFFTPNPGDVVYITFENGDASMPLWEYHGWADNECPYPLDKPGFAGIVTPQGNSIIIDEVHNTLKISFKGKVLINAAEDVVINSDTMVHLSGTKGVVINEGKNLGLIKIKELTDKLNKTIEELNQLKLELSTHTHTAPNGPTSPPVTPLQTQFSPYNMVEYMDQNTLH